MGYPLSQTLFTSLYIDRLLWPEPKSLEEAQVWREPGSHPGGPLLHRVLRAYCLGTIKSCDLVRTLICSQHFYEVCEEKGIPPWQVIDTSYQEEDFSTQLYNRQLLHDVDVDEIQLVLDDARALLEDSRLEAIVLAALVQRLTFRKELLSAYQADLTGLLRRDLSAHNACLSLVRVMEQSHVLAVLPDGAFSLKIQRSLASSVPPRPMVNIAYAKTLEFLTKLFQDVMDLTFVNEINGNERLLHAISLFMCQRPQPAIYVRSLLQSYLHQKSEVIGECSLKDFVFADLQSLVLPGSKLVAQADDATESLSDERSQVVSTMTDFVDRVGQQFLNIFRLACLNRARVRRTLCHFVADWDNLQVDGETIDSSLQNLTHEAAVEYDGSLEPAFSYPLSSWMYHYKLLLLRHIIQMGFELTIYATEEIPGMLWYLSHICTTHLAHLNRMSFFVEDGGREERRLENSAPYRLFNVEPALWKLDRIFQEVRAHENLAEALHALYTILRRHGLISNNSRPYSSNELRYELRMNPFLPLAIPAAISYSDFSRENSLSDENDDALVNRAYRAAGEARRSWENVLKDGWTQGIISPGSHPNSRKFDVKMAWMAEVKNFIRTSIATSIAVTAIRSRLDGAGGVQDRHRSSPAGLKGLTVKIPTHDEKGSYSIYPVPTIES